jgi:rhodanese-related sulfurtransferase
MQSFGNITNDPVAGITIPVWSSKTGKPSDLLHLTCDAQVLASEEASQIIRGIQGAVKLWPRSWSLVQAGLPLTEAQGSIGWSPYNPPVRLLNSETPSLALTGIARPTATLVGVHFFSPTIATFAFEIDTPLTYDPGQHIVLDCYHLLDTRIQMYTHMAQYRGGEKDLNDDGTRSWTISYASNYAKTKVQQFEVTLRRKERGGVTPGLFRRGWLLREQGQDESNVLTVEVLGLGGSCFLPLMDHSGAGTLQVAYLLSGIGLTPMLPHLSQLAQSGLVHARVLAVIAVKWDEIGVTRKLIRRALTRSQGSTISLQLVVYLLAGNVPDGLTEEVQAQEQGEEVLSSNFTIQETIIRGKRLQPSSFTSNGDSSLQDFSLPEEACQDLQRAKQIVVCAANAFSRTAAEALKQAGIADNVVKMESFSF